LVVKAPNKVRIKNAEIIPKPGILIGSVSKLLGANGENQPSMA
jgi:hypothetical protein